MYQPDIGASCPLFLICPLLFEIQNIFCHLLSFLLALFFDGAAEADISYIAANELVLLILLFACNTLDMHAFSDLCDLVSPPGCRGAVTVTVPDKVEVLKGNLAKLPCTFSVSPASSSNLVEWYIVSAPRTSTRPSLTTEVRSSRNFFSVSLSSPRPLSNRRSQETGSAWRSARRAASSRTTTGRICRDASPSTRTSR